MNIIEITPITDDTSIDEAYFHRVQSVKKYQDLSKEDIKLFNVTYYLKTNSNCSLK